MEDLKAKDPEFYSYLEQNDASLLGFGAGDEDCESEDEEISLESTTQENDSFKIPKSARHAKSIEVSDELLSKTLKGVESGSIRELQKLLQMFKFACHPYSDDDEWNDDEVITANKQSYTIPSADMYQQIVTKTIEKVHVCFRLQFDLSFPYKQSELQSMVSHPKWKKLSFCLFSFFQICLQNIKSLESQTQHLHVLLYFLKSLKDYIPFAFPLTKIHKRMYKALISLWSSYYLGAEDSSEMEKNNEGSTADSKTVKKVHTDSYQEVRGESVILLLQMMKFLPSSIIEEITRKIYLQFAKIANKPFTEQSSTSFAFFIHSACEIFTFDVGVAYQQSFLYIRQLALHLRNAFMKKGIESVKVVKSWQYVHCCRLWTKVITSCTSKNKSESVDPNGFDDDLSMLAFPLSQILLGILSLLPSAYYIPLRYHLIACLQQLAIYCKMFIPTAGVLVDILECSDLFSKPSPATALPSPLSYIIVLPPDSLLQQTVRNQVVQEAFRLLKLDIALYGNSNGFPEYALTIVRRIRQFVKRCSSSSQRKWREEAKLLVRTLLTDDETLKSSRNLILDENQHVHSHPLRTTRLPPIIPSVSSNASDSNKTVEPIPQLTISSSNNPKISQVFDEGETKIRRVNLLEEDSVTQLTCWD